MKGAAGIGPTPGAVGAYTPVPDVLLDHWLGRLTHAELRVLLYILRCSPTAAFSPGSAPEWGRSAPISLRQLGEGCGMKSRGHICAALEGLEEKGLIRRERSTREDGGADATRYEYVWEKR